MTTKKIKRDNGVPSCSLSRQCSCLGHHCCLCKARLDDRGAGRTYVARTKRHNLCPACAE